VRTVYLGTSDFAASILGRLATTTHRPGLVVTQPDRLAGRGRRPSSPPVAECARELEIELAQTDDASGAETVERIVAAEPEIGVVCAFGQLLREPLLSDLELLNVHPSLLPRWRGAAPIERAIMAGDDETGVSIMRVTEALDAGAVALQERVPIGRDAYGALAGRLAALGAELLIRALDLRAAGQLELRDQDPSGVVYARRIEPSERRLDPSRPAGELERTVRALSPHIGAYLELADGTQLGVLAVVAEDGDARPGEPVADHGLRFGCREGVLRLIRVRPAGGREMGAEDYLRGHPVPRLA
jgi:methionyl-tRNA formyltransferase